MGGVKRRGRPPLEDGQQSTPVHVRVPDALYDEACRAASRQSVTVPELIRRSLERVLTATGTSTA